MEIHLDALDRYARTKVHFVDCLIAATAAAENMPVASFDYDFRKFSDIRAENRQFSALTSNASPFACRTARFSRSGRRGWSAISQERLEISRS